jgi:predicted metal-dependent phosphotriesterase family hydrolase
MLMISNSVAREAVSNALVHLASGALRCVGSVFHCEARSLGAGGAADGGGGVVKPGRLKAAGVDTIVDPTVVGLGRYVPRVQRVNAEVGINIVGATGLYTFDAIPHYFHYRGPGTLMGGPELMTDMFVRDVREGIGSHDISPALSERGVAEEEIHTMLVDNPRRYFTVAG